MQTTARRPELHFPEPIREPRCQIYAGSVPDRDTTVLSFQPRPATMAKKKSRIINVRLISMAMTGFFYNFKRPRVAPPMGMLKYDPIGLSPHHSHEYFAAPTLTLSSSVRKKVLFLESKKRVR